MWAQCVIWCGTSASPVHSNAALKDAEFIAPGGSKLVTEMLWKRVNSGRQKIYYWILSPTDDAKCSNKVDASVIFFISENVQDEKKDDLCSWIQTHSHKIWNIRPRWMEQHWTSHSDMYRANCSDALYTRTMGFNRGRQCSICWGLGV